MEKIVFEKIDPLVDDIADELGELLESDAFKLVKAKLAELSRELHECSISLDMNLQVFDAEREQSLPLSLNKRTFAEQVTPSAIPEFAQYDNVADAWSA